MYLWGILKEEKFKTFIQGIALSLSYFCWFRNTVLKFDLGAITLHIQLQSAFSWASFLCAASFYSSCCAEVWSLQKPQWPLAKVKKVLNTAGNSLKPVFLSIERLELTRESEMHKSVNMTLQCRKKSKPNCPDKSIWNSAGT